MDFGVGELPSPVVETHAHGPAGRDKQDLYVQGNVTSMDDMDLQPPPGTLPYLVPKANVSRESLHSLSDPRDDPYGIIYSSSAPPSPGGVYSHSDQHSISGRSTRNLLAPTPQIDEQNSSPFTPSRVPSPLAISEAHTPQKDISPSKPLTPLHSEATDPLQMAGSARSLTRSPLQDSTFSHEGETIEPNSFRTPLKISSSTLTERTQPGPTENNRPVVDDISGRSQSRVRADPQRVETSSGAPGDFNSLYPSHGREEEAKSGIIEDAGDDITDLYLEERNVRVQNSNGFGSGVSHVDVEEDEDHAKRIQSVYREYWGDSQYYDGSEEWESLPQISNGEAQYQSAPAMPPNPNRTEWRDSVQGSYDERGWQYQSKPGDYDHHGRYNHSKGSRDPVGAGIDVHWHSPPGRPSVHSRPSTSYSTSSLPTRVRTPTQSLEPLNNLPSTRDKLDDLASPISFSKPRRFAGPTGRASPINRPASPAQVLSPAWSRLAELPVPHRLRRSGSFSSIDFAPTRKYGPIEMDVGDTGSVRSLARTEASLMAVTAGAGRVDRLPHDLVPVGKVGTLANLRPQNYDSLHYV